MFETEKIFEQRALIKFCTKNGLSAMKMFEMIKTAYTNSALLLVTVKRLRD